MKEKKDDDQDIETHSSALDKAAHTYEWWRNLSTINEEDPIWLGFLKILLRILGILIMLALSPLIILGILFAFLAAS